MKQWWFIKLILFFTIIAHLQLSSWPWSTNINFTTFFCSLFTSYLFNPSHPYFTKQPLFELGTFICWNTFIFHLLRPQCHIQDWNVQLLHMDKLQEFFMFQLDAWSPKCFPSVFIMFVLPSYHQKPPSLIVASIIRL
jgi:hypothetical protein